MTSAEHSRRRHGFRTDQAHPFERLRTRPGTSGTQQKCYQCGHNTPDTTELVDVRGHVVAIAGRCRQCPGRHRHREKP